MAEASNRKDELLKVEQLPKEEDSSEDKPLYTSPWGRPQFKGCQEYEPVDVYVANTAKGESGEQLNETDEKFRFGFPEMTEIPEPNVIINAMKCSLCSRIPTPDALMCREGHLICSACGMSVAGCPFRISVPEVELENTFRKERSCGKRITNARHQLITHLYLNSTFNCPNRGCLTRMMGKELYWHENDCRYTGFVKCQSREDCGMRTVQFSMYPMHLKKAHGMNMIEGSRRCFMWDYHPDEASLGSVVKEIFNHCGKMFALVIEVSGNMFNIWLSDFEELDEDHENFVGYIQITSPQGTSQMYFGKIYSFRDKTDIVNRSWCLAVPLKSIPYYINIVLGEPMLLVDVFIQAWDRSQKCVEWKNCNRDRMKQNVSISTSLESFELSAAINAKIEQIRAEPAVSTELNLCTEGFKEFQRLFDENWKPTLEVHFGAQADDNNCDVSSQSRGPDPVELNGIFLVSDEDE